MDDRQRVESWFLARGEQQWGPFGADDWRRIIREGRIGPEDWVWSADMTDWMPAGRVPGLLAPTPPRFRPPPVAQDASPTFAQQPQYASPQLQQFVATTHTQAAPAVDVHGTRVPVVVEAPHSSAPTTTAMAAYVMYLIFFIPLLPLIALIISLVNMNSKPEWLASHFRYQLRTVLFQFLFAVVGIITIPIFVGFPILIGTAVWAIVRHVRGISALNRGEAIG